MVRDELERLIIDLLGVGPKPLRTFLSKFSEFSGLNVPLYIDEVVFELVASGRVALSMDGRKAMIQQVVESEFQSKLQKALRLDKELEDKGLLTDLTTQRRQGNG